MYLRQILIIIYFIPKVPTLKTTILPPVRTFLYVPIMSLITDSVNSCNSERVAYIDQADLFKLLFYSLSHESLFLS